MLHRSPGFSLIAIAIIALGVGATTAVYSVIDATLLHPLPYPSPANWCDWKPTFPGWARTRSWIGSTRSLRPEPTLDRWEQCMRHRL
jgi:hypothetical protein